jgi:hypothetical protein
MLPVEEMKQKLAAIESLALITYGANEIEHLLADLLEFIGDHLSCRDEFEFVLVDMLDRGPEGMVMTMEFLMHTLKWPMIEAELQRRLTVTSNWNDRRVLERILAAFSDGWEDGDIYDRYRID